MDRLTSGVSYAGSGAAVLVGGLSANDIAILVGTLCAIVTVAINWHHKREVRRILREQAPPAPASDVAEAD